MEAKELRIGNWVGLYVYAMYVNDMQFDRMHFDIFSPINQDYICKPIPLTEGWLLKFGFKKSKHWYTFGGISISADLNRLTHEVNGTHVEFYNQFKCPEYVHQLQNLYFALTGEELTIKSNTNDKS